MAVFKRITALAFAILVCAVSLALTVINVTVTVKSILYPNVPPEIFGYSAIAMGDGASEGNKSDSISRGSIVIFKKEKIEIGKNVAYRDSNGAYIVGRVTSANEDADGNIKYRIKADALEGEYLELMSEQTYIGTFNKELRLLGAAVQFSSTLPGQILFVWIPAIIAFIMFVWEIIVTVSLRTDAAEEKETRKIFEPRKEKARAVPNINEKYKKRAFTLLHTSLSGLGNLFKKRNDTASPKADSIYEKIPNAEHPSAGTSKTNESAESAIHITSKIEESVTNVDIKTANENKLLSKSPTCDSVTEIKTVKIGTGEDAVSSEPVIPVIKKIPLSEESISIPTETNDTVPCLASAPDSDVGCSEPERHTEATIQVIPLDTEEEIDTPAYSADGLTKSCIASVENGDTGATESYGVDLKLSERDFTFAKLRKSFLAKLIQSDDEIKEYYSELKNELLSYKGIKSRFSWGVETFKYRREHIARINVKGRTLHLYVALDPEEFKDTKYFSHDATGLSRYEGAPMMIKVKSERGVRHGKELIAIVAERLGLLKNPKYTLTDYRPPYESTMALIEKKLIKDLTGCYAEIKASVADSLMTDAHAEKLKVEEEIFVSSDKRRRGIVNIDTLSDNFSAGDEITLDKMKEQIKGFDKKMTFVKVLARGTLNKPLTVHADDFSIGAVKMLLLTGGKAVFPKKKQ